METDNTTLTLIVIAKDAESYDDFLSRLDVIGAVRNTVVVPDTAIPRNLAQAFTFAEEMKPYLQPIILRLKLGSTLSARILDFELVQSHNT